MVVHDVCQMVSGQVVRGFIEHFIVQDIGVDDHLSADEIMDMYVLVGLHFEANNVLRSCINAGCHLFCGHR